MSQYHANIKLRTLIEQAQHYQQQLTMFLSQDSHDRARVQALSRNIHLLTQKVDRFPVKTSADIQLKLSFYAEQLGYVRQNAMRLGAITEKIKQLYANYQSLVD